MKEHSVSSLSGIQTLIKWNGMDYVESNFVVLYYIN